ncbi:MAG: hypothetical protein J6X18_05620 [Bacteroidales bacterium]|nr:hypothetical protein [Bacteroidales bacterium]
MPRKITQPRKNGSATPKPDKRRKVTKVPSGRRVFPEKAGKYGMSKLEAYFAKNFLNKFNVKYVYEYEASDIGRFYDFAIVAVAEGTKCVLEEKNGVISLSQKRNYIRPILIIEVDGSYYHSDPRIVKESEMNLMQKRNKVIDEYKDDWCRVHHIPILRVWEYDIYNNPKLVMKQIKDALNGLETSD